MSWPNEPNTSNPISAWCLKLMRACKASELKSGVGYRVKRTAQGTTLELGAGAPGTTAQNVTVKWCQIIEILQDHYVVQEWDGDAVFGDEFNVAKPTKLRGSITTETIDGDAITYDYTGYTTDYIQRLAEFDGAEEKQVVVPHWLAEDLIWALEVTETGVQVSSVEVTWLDLNIDARAWARKFDQS